ncbi:sulfite exporter TauE/SafE family protein [Lutimonas halocynthiae]|uniref:sulfite exporter TauE/SafE family protein n=1 Tax=Lutimonas halocynthiae TaxID=1446477 RepID=UPI0025B4D596|nr:sulfite exporter TauE/SafE family protein [Lutimonas halocynthiae]MDN3643737.1 sulfite exporter TauE/SafE family protein [Lutimonas halocynthiae]
MELELILLAFIGLVTGVINTLAGGGSLLTLPMLIFLGLPPSVANGTNRIAILIQSIVTNAGFRSKGINTYPFSIYFGISATLGAILGAQLAIEIDGALFNKILAIIMVIVVAYLVLNRKAKLEDVIERVSGKHLWTSIILFFFVGIYGGFIQAGVGFLMLLVLSGVNRFSLVKSNALKIVITGIYTVFAVIIFMVNDKINWEYGLILAFGNAVGGWFASRWSVSKGDGLVKIFLIVMVIIMAIKLWFFTD